MVRLLVPRGGQGGVAVGPRRQGGGRRAGDGGDGQAVGAGQVPFAGQRHVQCVPLVSQPARAAGTGDGRCHDGRPFPRPPDGGARATGPAGASGRHAMSEPPRTVLFIVTSFWAYGELAIATEFAGRMAGSGFRPLFLIPPTHREQVASAGLDHQVMIPGAGKINRIQLHDIQHVRRPALVVLADFLNFDFCDRHYGLRRDDLSVFDCPIGTFDDFSWGRAGAWLDTYGFKAKYEGDITLDGLSFRLRPCPLNNPLSEVADPGVYPYPLLENVADVASTERAAVRRELGLTAGRPVVLVTGASWQRIHAGYPRVPAVVHGPHPRVERPLS